jgi:hypothetical protein
MIEAAAAAGYPPAMIRVAWAKLLATHTRSKVTSTCCFPELGRKNCPLTKSVPEQNLSGLPTVLSLLLLSDKILYRTRTYFDLISVPNSLEG